VVEASLSFFRLIQQDDVFTPVRLGGALGMSFLVSLRRKSEHPEERMH